MRESAWLTYLLVDNLMYQVPGPGLNAASTYRTFVYWSAALDLARVEIVRTAGLGEEYDEVRIIRIGASDIIDNRVASASEQSLIPAHLNTADYHAVVEYYGLD